jgi:glutamyl-tRNA reductase
MNRYVVVGLSHKSAPVSVRERLQADDGPELTQFRRESVVLSTCNRFEVYLYGDGSSEEIYEWMRRRSGLSLEEIREHSFERVGRNACKHLCFVASSLDSLVVGETQIRGQVKDAYRRAQEADTIGPALHRLFRSALRVSKEISETTGVGKGSVSVAGAAADLAERVFGQLDDAELLVLGAGETASLLASHLHARGVRRFVVLNRTLENANELAERIGGRAGGLDELSSSLITADIVATAAGGSKPVLTAQHMRSALRARRGRPVVALDISVPRGMDPEIGSMDNVYRYDMDALAAVTRDALRHRRSDFLQCCSLIDAAVLRLDAEARAGDAGATIAAVERAYRVAADETLSELERRLPDLPESDREHVRRGIDRLVKRLLHLPKRALRQGSEEEREWMRRVFAPQDAEE